MLQKFWKQLPVNEDRSGNVVASFLQPRKLSEAQKGKDQTNLDQAMKGNIAERNWFAAPQSR